MAQVGRPRLYPDEKTKWREVKRRQRHRARLAVLAPDAICRTIGNCTLYLSRCEFLYPLLPRKAAVVSDPPYPPVPGGYDNTKTRRNPSQWPDNFPGWNQPFDPTPWLKFADVMLFGA